MADPSERQMATLRAVAAAPDGSQKPVDDSCAADECCWAGWLLAEGDSGYALTSQGRATMRRLF
jgi:hypothetical protein